MSSARDFGRPTARRCAIYTRKSHEEGLDQAFNSLDAQREAGTDYIKSQKHEGWQLVDQHYDDGGYSGGNTQRPGLQRLLSDIAHGAVDVVVVYKVDRLSRSLHDFAHLMKHFEDHKVSFVSVTQQFNTTTSMGRLTLNMLLSFAQFEREVTGERIRDKIAATKKRGMWVTGQPPLGYRNVERQLVIVPEEAKLVRGIYNGYLSNQSLLELAKQLNDLGHTTRHWQSSRGKWHGGKKLTPKYLNRVLTNPIYIGKVTHKGNVWPGKHKAIVDRATWNRVQKAIDNRQSQTKHRWVHPYLLKGKLKTHEGATMSPSAVHRPGRGEKSKRLVRYYVSQKALREGYRHCEIKTINAEVLDELVRSLVLDHLASGLSRYLVPAKPQVRDHTLRACLESVVLAPNKLSIVLNEHAILSNDWIVESDSGLRSSETICPYQPEVSRRADQIVLTLPIQIKRLDGRRILLSPEGRDLVLPTQPTPRDHIVTAIGHAYRWRAILMEPDSSIKQIAEEEHCVPARIHKYLKLINLGPDLLRMALGGYLPPRVTLNNLLQAASHLNWADQLAYLNLDDHRRSG